MHLFSSNRKTAGLLRLFTNCYTSATKHGIIMSIYAQKNYNLESAFCTKSSINQVVKCAKKLINILTKWVNMLKGSLHQGGKSFGVVCVRVLCQFSVSPRMYMPILPDKLQKITKCFQCGYKTKTKLKHRTHYAIFQNRRICASCQLYGLVHYAACVFLPIYKWLAFCSCE